MSKLTKIPTKSLVYVKNGKREIVKQPMLYKWDSRTFVYTVDGWFRALYNSDVEYEILPLFFKDEAEILDALHYDLSKEEYLVEEDDRIAKELAQLNKPPALDANVAFITLVLMLLILLAFVF
jgi:hypothetical protein